MKIYLAVLMIVSWGMFSCNNEKETIKICKMTAINGFEYYNDANTIIPIDTRNFWVYEDSIWSVDGSTLDTVKSALIKIETVYDLHDGNHSLHFSSLIPPLTVGGDTLYSNESTWESTEPDCYKLRPKFFDVKDTVWIPGTANNYVYLSQDTVRTKVGDFTNNIVCMDGNVFEYIIHKDVGIIKISYSADLSSKKRRTLTLKDYNIE